MYYTCLIVTLELGLIYLVAVIVIMVTDAKQCKDFDYVYKMFEAASHRCMVKMCRKYFFINTEVFLLRLRCSIGCL